MRRLSLFLALCGGLWAQSLGELSASFQALARRVNPSVVKVVATGYRTLDADESDEPGVTAKQQSSGSGVIVGEAGLIITNAHVVMGAQRVQVTLAGVRPPGRTLRAEIAGIDLETDIALLRIREKSLPALKLADSDTVEQGQIVLAFGSPLGLENSVSMGVVSSTARQLKSDDPMIYIQTDAPINPGNSGGPLVDIEGRVVGINTLIMTQSGGSEGLGFAVPSNLVSNVMEQILKKGRVVRGDIGVSAQTITPTLAAAWKLPQETGVVIADVDAEGPAEQAGLRVGDVVRALNGKLMENALHFNINVYRPAIGETVQLEVLRGRNQLSFAVKVIERRHEHEHFADMASRDENLIGELGIFAIDLNEDVIERAGPFRRSKGVYVAARHADGPLLEENFHAGDVIYTLNREAVVSVAALRGLLKGLKSGDAVAAQVERDGRLRFVAFELP